MVTWSCIIYDEMWSVNCTDQIAIGLVLMFLLIIQPDELMHCIWLEPQEPEFEFNSGQISEKFFNFSSRSREFLVWVNGEFELSRFYCTSNLNNDSWLWTDTTLLHEYGISNYIKPSMHVCGIICHLINLDLPPLVVLLPFNNRWKWLPIRNALVVKHWAFNKKITDLILWVPFCLSGWSHSDKKIVSWAFVAPLKIS